MDHSGNEPAESLENLQPTAGRVTFTPMEPELPWQLAASVGLGTMSRRP